MSRANKKGPQERWMRTADKFYGKKVSADEKRRSAGKKEMQKDRDTYGYFT